MRWVGCLGLLLFIVGCSKSLDLTGKRCPCVPGSVCDETTDTCKPLLDAGPDDDATDPDADSGGPDVPGDAGSTRKRVFVTSGLFNGNLGGVSGADIKCNDAATGADLGGEWIAWVSTADELIVDRLNDVGPWYLVDGQTLVADNKGQLTAPDREPELHHAIDMTEAGGALSSGLVWTGTKADGTLLPSRCSEWLSSSPAPAYGYTGNLDQANRYWTDNLSGGCNTQARLYCFEQ